MRAWVAVGSVVTSVALSFSNAGCHDSDAAPQSRRELVIVSPHWEGIREELGAAFRAHMANRTDGRAEDVDVAWVNPGGTSACLRFARARFERMPEGIGVDLFFGGGVDPHLKLAELGLTQPADLSAEVLAALPEDVSGVRVYDHGSGWYGTCLTTFGIVYNRELLRRIGLDEPTSFDDLGEPRFRSWVGLADPRMSGTVHMIYELILQGQGWEDGFRLLARMAGNSRRFYHHASEVPLEVGAGEIAAGLSLDSYAWAQVDQLGRESIGFLAPDGETVVNPDAISMLHGAPAADLASAFIEFVLSPQGQALWMLPRGTDGGPTRYSLARMPVRPDVMRSLGARAIVTFDPFGAHHQVAYDPSLGSNRWGIVNGLLGSVLVDLQRDLAKNWQLVIAAGRPAAAEELLTRPPVGLDELLALAAGPYRDHRERQAIQARWSREARARYREAGALAQASASESRP
jgi:ABC-type Fe3+ transport system substrate-binding protein